MLYSLLGELIHIESGMCVIECAGVGYKCFITANTQRNLPKLGTKTRIYTYLNVREDAIDLFGFLTQEELNCFKLLISVSGVGSRAGLSILSELLPEEVALSIASGDSKMLTRASGIGNKIAQRIILELKDKLKNIPTEFNTNNNYVSPVQSFNNTSKAIEALTVLGYAASEVLPVVRKFDPTLSVEELIRLCLKSMAEGK